VTSAQTILNDPESAPREIDRVLSVCLTKLSPVYISLPAYALLEVSPPHRPAIHTTLWR
jgi:TPP-dependent 2-oxoacid decarboxylase